MNSLSFDHLGNRIYGGKTVREFSWLMENETAVPSKIVVTGSGVTTAFNNLATADKTGEIVLNNNTISIEARASWFHGFSHTEESIVELAFYVYDLRFDTNDPTKIRPAIALSVDGAQGAWLGHRSDNTFGSSIFNTANGGAVENNAENYDFVNYGIGQGKKNIGIIYRPREKMIYLTEGDEKSVILSRSVATLANWPSAGLLTPYVAMQNVDGLAHWMRFSGMMVRVVTG